MSQKLQKVFLVILVVILSFLTVPKLVKYSIEMWDYIEVEVFAWNGGYRIIDTYEIVLNLIPAIIFFAGTLIILFVKRIPLFIKNLIITSFVIGLILIARIWYFSYSESPWLYNNRIQYNGVGEYTHLYAN